MFSINVFISSNGFSILLTSHSSRTQWAISTQGSSSTCEANDEEGNKKLEQIKIAKKVFSLTEVFNET